MKPRFKLVASSHYGFYEWVLTHGEIAWKGAVIPPGTFFCIPKFRFWEDGFK